MHGRTTDDVGERFPHADHPTGPPRRAGLFNEIGILREPLRLAARTPSLAHAPRGDGRLTITIPGWYAPESSLAPIRSFLGRTGHDARSWGLGVIRNDVEAARDQFIAQLDRQVAATGRSAHLVGWSLGGVIARETARLRPELVHRVVTFGTPAIGGPTYTAGADRMGAEECRRIEQLQTELDESNPIGTPITAVYTRPRRCRRLACLHRPLLDERRTHRGPIDTRRTRRRPRRLADHCPSIVRETFRCRDPGIIGETVANGLGGPHTTIRDGGHEGTPAKIDTFSLTCGLGRPTPGAPCPLDDWFQGVGGQWS